MKVLVFCIYIVVAALVVKETHRKLDLDRIIQRHKNQLGITKFTKDKAHYFDLKVNHCFKNLLPEKQFRTTTYYLYKQDLVYCIIEKIELKSKSQADSAYSVLRSEAEGVRKGARRDFGDVCFELREAQFYFASKQESCIYLFSDGGYNYHYKGAGDSCDAIINRDQASKNELIFDDIFRAVESEIAQK